MHCLLALGLTFGIVGGALGLGRVASVTDASAAAVVGLQLLWWPAALVGTVWSPGAAAALVVAASAVGLVVLATRWSAWREAAIMGGFMLVGAPVWLAPPVFYDALVYHLGMPWSWLHNGSMASAAHNLFSHFPLAASVVFLAPVRLGLPEAAAGIHWACLGLAVLAAVDLARRLGGGRLSWLAGLCAAASWHALWIAGVAAVDQIMVLAVVVAAAEGVDVLSGQAKRPWLAGVALGLALAVKYTAAVPVAALLTAVVLIRPARWRWGVGAGLVAVASSSFWYLRNLLATGNPVYPLFWNLLGGKGWSAADNVRYLATVREGVGGWGSAWRGLLQLADPSRGLGWWLAPAALVGGVAVWRARREAAVRWLGVVVVLMTAGWLATSHTTRYALVLAPLVGALAARGTAGLGRFARATVVVALVLGAAVGVVNYGEFTFGQLGWLHWLGGRDAAESWRHRVTVNDPAPAWSAADRLLPPDARVLIVADGRSWGCPRAHHASSAYDTQLVQRVVERSGSATGAVRRLEDMGFSHLMINWGEMGRLHGPPFRVLAWRDDEARRRWIGLGAASHEVWRSGSLQLLELP